MSDRKPCTCDGGGKLIFACSGAADVGEVADRAARRLSKMGAAKMYCTTGLGGQVGQILERTRNASAILAIDGCDMDCAKNCLDRAGVSNYRHLRLSTLGMLKGKSPANDARVDFVVVKASLMLEQPIATPVGAETGSASD